MSKKPTTTEKDIPVEEPKTEHVPLTDNVKVADKKVEAKPEETKMPEPKEGPEVSPPPVKDKTLTVTSSEEAKAAGTQVVGDPDAWKLICKAWNAEEGWMKSTKAMPLGVAGCLVQVTTQQRNADGSYALAENVCFAANANVIQQDGRWVIKQ